MSFLFGKKKNTIVPSSMDTLSKLKENINSLELREKHLDQEISKYKDYAKTSIKQGNKQKALNFMRKVKMLEKQVEFLYGAKNNLETQINAIEQSIISKNIVDTVKQSKITMDVFNKQNNPDEIADMFDDISETINSVNEISDIISRPIQLTNDEELLKELEDINELEFPHIPHITTQLTPPNTVKNELNDLKELEKLMIC